MGIRMGARHSFVFSLNKTVKGFSPHILFAGFVYAGNYQPLSREADPTIACQAKEHGNGMRPD